MPNHPPTEDGSWRHQLRSSKFPVEADRYHVYVGLFCPFAQRVLVTRELKGLAQYLPLSIVKPYPKEGGGWRFPSTEDEYPGSTVDHLFHSKFLHEVYLKSDPGYKGKYSVPVLWDKKTNQIVNNESEDIMRMLNTAFNDLLPPNATAQRELNFYPEELRPQIDDINSWMMPDLNAGVYKAGFANDQQTYETNCRIVFDSLDRFEAHLSENPHNIFILGPMTEIDIKLYTTLVRFDTIYQQHFKLMIGSIRHNYPHLHRWLKHLYWKVPGVRETTDFKHIKENYSKSHADINPKAITPLGPDPDVEAWTEEDEVWRKERVGP
ncbi:MAG: hypothetical protein LQ338_002169 [Usnochroma carphineum]|nr:MAG: hypothetical protein LQ338_002169 [Usnochroma carphineum]